MITRILKRSKVREGSPVCPSRPVMLRTYGTDKLHSSNDRTKKVINGENGENGDDELTGAK